MATSERQRQKKREKQNKKRQLVRKATAGPAARGSKATAYLSTPIHECLVPSGLFEGGLGSVVVSRLTRTGEIAVSAFVLDVFCLGVKDAFFTLLDEARYRKELVPSLLASHGTQSYREVDPPCMKKLITECVRYAEDLGFRPHADYKGAIALLNDVDAAACPTELTFGRDGRPFYIQGPHESPAQVRRILEQLTRRCGTGNFDSMVVFGDVGPGSEDWRPEVPVSKTPGLSGQEQRVLPSDEE